MRDHAHSQHAGDALGGRPGPSHALLEAAVHGPEAWLSQARNTRLIGGGFWSPSQAVQAALGRSFDVVIHLHQVKAAQLLP
ncbi:hypothetical protein GCM10010176_021890 [Nonomuraea spiralis]|nr:hypothetical protein GCM10010176_021890 [Nonomuraea spiralis]